MRLFLALSVFLTLFPTSISHGQTVSDFTPPIWLKTMPIQLEGSVVSSPVIADGKIVIGTTTGKLYCIRLSPFEIVWTKDNEGSFRSSCLVANKRIYTGDSLGRVYCRNLDDGEIVWGPREFGEWIYSTPILNDGKIIFGGNDRKIHALDAETGEKIWETEELRGQVQAGVALCNEGYIVGCLGQPDSESDYDPGNLYCITADGKILWGPKVTKGPVQGTPSVFGEHVFAASYGYSWENDRRPKGRVTCFRTSDGASIWHKDLEKEIWGSPATNGDCVITGSRDHFIWCLDANSGEERWHFQTGGMVDATAVIENGACWIGGMDGNLYALDLQSGKKLQEINVASIGLGPQNSVAISEGYLVCASLSGTLYRFDLAPSCLVRPTKSSYKSYDGSYYFEIRVENIRKEDSPDLEVTLVPANCFFKEEPKKVLILSGKHEIITFEGKIDPEPSTYTCEIEVSSNSPTIILQDENGNTTNRLLLELIIKTHSPRLGKLPERIDFGAFWDDETPKQKMVLIQNEGDGVIQGSIASEKGLLPDKNTFISTNDAPAALGIELDVNSLPYGTFERVLDVKSNAGNAKIVFTGEKLRSKNIVEVWVSKKTARINGQEKTLVQAPYIKNNLTMVPLRLVSEGLGLEVSWVPEVKTIIINLFSGWYLRLIIGYKKALIERPDGGIDELQAQSPPEIISGTTFVPLRLVGDALSRGGSKINIAWKGKNRKATISRSLKTGK